MAKKPKIVWRVKEVPASGGKPRHWIVVGSGGQKFGPFKGPSMARNKKRALEKSGG